MSSLHVAVWREMQPLVEMVIRRSTNPMTDVSKLAQWRPLLKEWQSAVEPLGLAVEKSPHAYEIATVKGPNVSLVIYPYRTAARCHVPRVRDNSSKDKTAAKQAAEALGLWARNNTLARR